MKIGLYSALARSWIDTILETISPNEDLPIKNRIREFRHRVLLKYYELENYQKLYGSDFFTLSSCRDFFFHVQENRFTPDMIKNHLNILGLAFCGFQLPSRDLIRFKNEFKNSDDQLDLECWQRFEESYPDTFSGMYNFWCRLISD